MLHYKLSFLLLFSPFLYSFFLFSFPLLFICFFVPQQSMRENKEKQALGDLMIKPVQRIPRYELLVKVSRLRLRT